MRVIQCAISALLVVIGSAAALETCANSSIPSLTPEAAAATPVVRMSSREAPMTQVLPPRPGADLLQAVETAQEITCLHHQDGSVPDRVVYCPWASVLHC